MALKFTQKNRSSSGSGGTYDHNLLINRGLPDQHTMESITGLRDALAKKYEKPFSGIPKSHLAFDVATLHDLDILKNTEILNIANDLANLVAEVYQARGTEDTLKEYIDTKVSFEYWSGSGGVNTGGGSINHDVGYPLYETYYATEGQTNFPLAKNYQMGTRQLEVYVNGLRMVQDDDYTETDDHTIDFLFELEKDDLVLFMVRSVVNSGLHEEFVASEGQTDFTLVNPYGIYLNILQVYRNGTLQRKGRDYLEVHDHLVKFLYPMKNGDLITFHQAGATDPLAGTIMESEIGRIKLNQAYQTMNVNEKVGIEQTDYIDMYVDVFLDDAQIDQEKSLTYIYEDQSIKVGDTTIEATTTKDFQRGIVSGVDVTTYLDEIRLLNAKGGAEINDFGTYKTTLTTSVVADTLFVQTNNRRRFCFGSVDLPSGVTEITLKIEVQTTDGTIMNTTQTVDTTTGYFLGLRGYADRFGRVHFVYHEQGVAGEKAKVHYILFDELGIVLHQLVVSDPLFDAVAPDVAADIHGNAHIVFNSKRVVSDRFNIEYIAIEDGVPTGIRSVAVQTLYDSRNPSVDVDGNNIVKVVFETNAFNGTHRNIKYVEIENGIVVYEDYLTENTFDNTVPDISVDTTNTARIVWRSKRITANWGIDYCSVSSSRVASSTKAIVESTTSLICGIPRIATDHEDISHIVVHANQQHSDYNNIVYTYVYPDNTIVPYKNISALSGISLNDPDVSISGDTILVGFYDTGHLYSVLKSIGNYESMGRFDITFDSRSEDTLWKQLLIDAVIHTSTSITVSYRLSSDNTMWSPWYDVSELSIQSSKGRYIQIRIVMNSSDHLRSPEVLSISALCEPLWTEIYSLPKYSSKQITSAIVAARYDGEVQFSVSRDSGGSFTDAVPEQAVNLMAAPFGDYVVLRARIKKGSQLHAWSIVW